MVNEVIGGREIHRDHALPHCQWGVLNRGVLVQAGVADKAIELAVIVDDLRDQFAHSLMIGYIDRFEFRTVLFCHALAALSRP